MADDKKGGKKPAPAPDESSTSIGFVFIILLMLILVVIPNVASFFGFSFSWYNEQNFINVKAFLTELTSNVLTSISFISIFCIFIFSIGIYYARFQKAYILEEYTRKLKEKYEQKEKPAFRSTASAQSTHRPPEHPLPHGVVPGFPGAEVEPLRPDPGMPHFGAKPEPTKHQVVNPRWEEIKQHIVSHSPSEWRVAILEADILLYEMLDQMGYVGDSIADKMKQVDKTSFHSIDEAWRAHRVRNMIAHQGNQYEISRYEAEKTIKLYQKVFEEFYFI